MRTLLLPCVWLCLTSVSLASVECPLKSKSLEYSKLRKALVALSADVLLDPNCEKERELLRKSSRDLLQTTESLPLLGQNPGLNKGAGQISVQQSITSLETIWSVLGSSCGSQLYKKKDYLLAFLDSVNAITPYALIFGSEDSAALLLGTLLVGNVIRTIWTMISPEDIMRDPKVRAIFETNVCTFNELDHNLMALQDAEMLGEEKFSLANENLTKKLKSLENSVPALGPTNKESSAMKFYLDELYFQQDELSFLEAKVNLYKESDFVCSLIQKKIRPKNSSGNYFSYLSTQLLRDSLEKILLTQNRVEAISTNHDLERLAYFESVQDNSDRFDLAKPDDCATKSKQWIVSMKWVLTRSLESLAVANSGVNAYLRWLEKKEAVNEKIKANQERLRALKILRKTSFTEKSEAIDLHDEVASSLFAESRIFFVGKKSPAYYWLMRKTDRAEKARTDFSRGLKYFEKILKLESSNKMEICSTGRKLLTNYQAAWNHIHAADVEFCSGFSHLIDKNHNSRIHGMCYSKKSPVREELGKIINLEGKRNWISNNLFEVLKCKENSASF